MRKIEDITRELSNLEARITFALKSANVGIWEWQIDSKELIWDSNMLQLFGASKDEYNNENFFDEVVHPDDLSLVKQQFKHSLDCGDPFDIGYRIMYNGDWKRIRMRGAVRCDADGTNRCLIGIAFEDRLYCASVQYCENSQISPLQYSL